MSMDSDISLTGPQIAAIRRKLNNIPQWKFAKSIGMSQAAFSRRETNDEAQMGPEIILISMKARDAGIDIPTHDEALAFLASDASSAAAEKATS